MLQWLISSIGIVFIFFSQSSGRSFTRPKSLFHVENLFPLIRLTWTRVPLFLVFFQTFSLSLVRSMATDNLNGAYLIRPYLMRPFSSASANKWRHSSKLTQWKPRPTISWLIFLTLLESCPLPGRVSWGSSWPLPAFPRPHILLSAISLGLSMLNQCPSLGVPTNSETGPSCIIRQYCLYFRQLVDELLLLCYC